MKVANADRSYYTVLGNAAYRGVTTAGYLANQAIIKPIHIAVNAIASSVGHLLTTPPTLLEYTCFVPIQWLGRETLMYGAKCGGLSIVHRLIQGTLFSGTFFSMADLSWKQRAWREVISPEYIQSFYTNMTFVDENQLRSFLLTPTQKIDEGAFYKFVAHMMTITPFALLIIASVITRTGYAGIKSIATDIPQKYCTQQPSPQTPATDMNVPLAVTEKQTHTPLIEPSEGLPPLSSISQPESHLLEEIVLTLKKNN